MKKSRLFGILMLGLVGCQSTRPHPIPINSQPLSMQSVPQSLIQCTIDGQTVLLPTCPTATPLESFFLLENWF